MRTASDAQSSAFHAYAARCGTTLSGLVTSYLQHLLDNESRAQHDAEQI